MPSFSIHITRQRRKTFCFSFFFNFFLHQTRCLKGIFRLDTLLLRRDTPLLNIAMKMDRKMTLQIAKRPDGWERVSEVGSDTKVLQTISCHHRSSFDWKIKLVSFHRNAISLFIAIARSRRTLLCEQIIWARLKKNYSCDCSSSNLFCKSELKNLSYFVWMEKIWTQKWILKLIFKALHLSIHNKGTW